MSGTDLSAEEAEVEWRRCQSEAEIRAKDEEGVMRGPPTDDQGKIRFRKPKVNSNLTRDQIHLDSLGLHNR